MAQVCGACTCYAISFFFSGFCTHLGKWARLERSSASCCGLRQLCCTTATVASTPGLCVRGGAFSFPAPPVRGSLGGSGGVRELEVTPSLPHSSFTPCCAHGCSLHPPPGLRGSPGGLSLTVPSGRPLGPSLGRCSIFLAGPVYPNVPSGRWGSRARRGRIELLLCRFSLPPPT